MGSIDICKRECSFYEVLRRSCSTSTVPVHGRAPDHKSNNPLYVKRSLHFCVDTLYAKDIFKEDRLKEMQPHLKSTWNFMELHGCWRFVDGSEIVFNSLRNARTIKNTMRSRGNQFWYHLTLPNVKTSILDQIESPIALNVNLLVLFFNNLKIYPELWMNSSTTRPVRCKSLINTYRIWCELSINVMAMYPIDIWWPVIWQSTPFDVNCWSITWQHTPLRSPTAIPLFHGGLQL